jgi:hypothetical protein
MEDPKDREAVQERIRLQAEMESLRITQHAQQEMTEDGVTLDEVMEALRSGQVIENYPEHRRGSCCLVSGYTRQGRRPLHIVCTTAQPLLIVITVYEPKLPKWSTPTQRGRG